MRLSTRWTRRAEQSALWTCNTVVRSDLVSPSKVLWTKIEKCVGYRPHQLWDWKEQRMTRCCRSRGETPMDFFTVVIHLIICFFLVVVGWDVSEILKVLRAIHLEQIRGRK